MAAVKQILREVLEEITPSKEERASTLKTVNTFLAELNKSLKKNKLSAKAVLGGSYAKDTWLKGDYDVDIFVRFALKHKKDNLSSLLEKTLKPWKAEKVHGSRDYFWVHEKKFRFEIIPVLAIKKAADAENVTDFSPLHVKWVNKNGRKYKGDIRLFKKFCKAQRVYGAESYIRGFSGHVVDILVIYYKGFLPLLKAAAKWKPKTIIDYYHHYNKKALFVLNRSKIQGPLVVIDPVQKERNAAAALSQDKYNGLVSAAKKFLKRPSKDFFVETEIDLGKLAKLGHMIHVCAKVPKGKEDIIGTRLLHVFEYLKRYLEDFGIKASGWRWNKGEMAEFWYVVKEKELPATMTRAGPPLELKKAAEAFKKKHKKTFVSNHRLMAEVRRKHRTPEDAIRTASSDDYVKHRQIRLSIIGKDACNGQH
ncbi:MAG: CCA tRNA nucleotidyltransferase [Candidatus Woesearchaeota archaeon]